MLTEENARAVNEHLSVPILPVPQIEVSAIVTVQVRNPQGEIVHRKIKMHADGNPLNFEENLYRGLTGLGKDILSSTKLNVFEV